MKKISIFFLVFLFLPFSVLLGGNEKFFDDERTGFVAPVSSNDGGTILAKEWEIEEDCPGQKIIYQKDSFYILDYSEYEEVFIAKFSTEGDFIWEKEHLFSDNRQFYGYDGGNGSIFLSGFKPGEKQGFLMKLNSSGEIVWDIELKGYKTEVLYFNSSLIVGGDGLILEINPINGSIKQEFNIVEGLYFKIHHLFVRNDILYCVSDDYSDDRFITSFQMNGTRLSHFSLQSYESTENIFVGSSDGVYGIDSGMLKKWGFNGTFLLGEELDDFSYQSLKVKGETLYVFGATSEYSSSFLLNCYNLTFKKEGSYAWGSGTLYDICLINKSIYTLGYSSLSKIVITKWVPDRTIPSITNLQDATYEQSDNDVLLNWQAEDDNPANFTIYKNQTIIDAGLWDNENPISVEVDLSDELGLYNYKIIVNDLAGFEAQDSCIIRIRDTISPVIITEKYLNASSEIIWKAEDRNPDSYIVFKDGVEVSSGSWISNEEIKISSIELEDNAINYTIQLQDTSGNRVQSSIILTSSSNSGNGGVNSFNIDWLTIALVLIGLAIIGLSILLVVIIKRNNITIKKREKVYISQRENSNRIL